ncbi:hypothetical protein AAF712_000411 [Marasmius tenuissimus]|uniref:BTB domain-containing protein n=1 Tax=Marasmius tenuissimus TaxID=585030 RepID=A0ABR3AI15_9AGAR
MPSRVALPIPKELSGHDHESKTRHSLSFADGNIALLASNQYFVVHQGVLFRHSAALKAAVEDLTANPHKTTSDGIPLLKVQEAPDDLFHFLSALYDGLSEIKYNTASFGMVAAILRLSTHYQVAHLRKQLLRGLTEMWPDNLTEWDLRESHATSDSGLYQPRATIPHPILIINLARDVNAPELLPAAFYDLSRSLPVHITQGFRCSKTQEVHQLSSADLLASLKGREHASRFLSTFLVNYVEGRNPSPLCIYRRQHMDLSRQRACQAAFEGITFEILRESNDILCPRSSDPLFALMDSLLILTREDGRSSRPCEFCRGDFEAVVDQAREDFWRMLPDWFGVDVSTWV